MLLAKQGSIPHNQRIIDANKMSESEPRSVNWFRPNVSQIRRSSWRIDSVATWTVFRWYITIWLRVSWPNSRIDDTQWMSDYCDSGDPSSISGIVHSRFEGSEYHLLMGKILCRTVTFSQIPQIWTKNMIFVRNEPLTRYFWSMWVLKQGNWRKQSSKTSKKAKPKIKRMLFVILIDNSSRYLSLIDVEQFPSEITHRETVETHPRSNGGPIFHHWMKARLQTFDRTKICWCSTQLVGHLRFSEEWPPSDLGCLTESEDHWSVI
jgi:hypothetical protein